MGKTNLNSLVLLALILSGCGTERAAIPSAASLSSPTGQPAASPSPSEPVPPALRLASAPQRVLFIGDSITNHADWQTYFPALAADKCSQSGATSTVLLAKCLTPPPNRPDVIFVMWGINDIYYGGDDETVIANYRALAQAYAGIPMVIESVLLTDQNIWSDTMPTSRVLALNVKIKALAVELGIPYMNLNPLFANANGTSANPDLLYDGEHPNADGYAVWVNVINQLLIQAVN